MLLNEKIVFDDSKSKMDQKSLSVMDPGSKIEGLVIRIAIFGEQKCGKTALIKCYLDKDFSFEKQDTILNIYAKKIKVSGYPVTLVLCEVSEDISDLSLLTQITAEAHIIFLCYSLEDDVGHFNEVMIEESLANLMKVNENTPIFIVGCKFDLLQEESIELVKVYEKEGALTNFGNQIKEYMRNKKKTPKRKMVIGYYITSALLNINIDKLFLDAIRTVAFPYVLIKKENDSKNKDKKSKNKTKDSNSERTAITVEENGCILF